MSMANCAVPSPCKEFRNVGWIAYELEVLLEVLIAQVEIGEWSSGQLPKQHQIPQSLFFSSLPHE